MSTISRGFSPHDSDSLVQPIHLTMTSALKPITQGWSSQEKAAGRRLVKFNFRHISPNEIEMSFAPIPKEQYVPGEPIVSCVCWEERNEYFVTSVDIILLLEHILKQSFGVKEKNRIRRNLQSLKPLTISRSNRLIQNFFNLLMGMENPRPRNIEKDLKVFKWLDLFTAVKKVISKYSSTTPITSDAMDTDRTQTSESENVCVPSQRATNHVSRGRKKGSSSASGEFTSGKTLSGPVARPLDFTQINGQPGSNKQLEAYSESSSPSDSSKANGSSSSKSNESLPSYQSSAQSFVMTPNQNSSNSITSDPQSSDNTHSDFSDSAGARRERSSRKRKKKLKDRKSKGRAMSNYIQDQSDRVLGRPVFDGQEHHSKGLTRATVSYFQYPENSRLVKSSTPLTSTQPLSITGKEVANGSQPGIPAFTGKIQLPPILTKSNSIMSSQIDNSVDADQKRCLNQNFTHQG